MKSKKFKLAHAAIPHAYAPGYPRSLSREEFQALLAPRNRERVRSLWGAACATLALSACGRDGADRETPVLVGAPAPGPDRETQVLELLQRFAEEHQSGMRWLWRSTMVPESGGSATSGQVYVPRIPISFGNSSMGLFDAGSARRLAGGIFRAYGLELETGVEFDDALVHARLDGADHVRKLGFKLSGLAGNREMHDSGRSEPASTALDTVERAALEQGGWKLHVADMKNYPLMDGDQFTPTLAYLAGVIEFLNSVTDGPDVDLRPVLMGVRQGFPVPALRTLGLEGVTRAGDGDEFALSRGQTITLHFNSPGSPSPSLHERGRGWYEPLSGDLGRGGPLSTVGRISVLQLPVQLGWYAPGAKPEPLHGTLKQPREAGLAPLVIETRSELVFTPSSFDAARPFELTLELQPGKYIWKNSLDISALQP